MSHPVTWLDRARIERFVWTLDQRLYDLPRASRIAIRREVRLNLLSAAQDVGAGPALRQLGGTAALAAGYATAEFGEGPRHSWIAAAVFLTGFPFVVVAFIGEAASGFAEGVRAADPHATGTFTWDGVAVLQTHVTYAFTDGRWTSTGGALTPAAYAMLLVGTVLCGRLWRALPPLRRRATRGAAA